MTEQNLEMQRGFAEPSTGGAPNNNKGVFKKLEQSKKIKRDKSGRQLIKVDKETTRDRN